jgi:hypothetical protein
LLKFFARFSENVLYFCRPHPTLVVGANFCGCIFFDPCPEKIIKNSEKIKKGLIPTSAFWKNQEKIQEKGKIRVFLFVVCVLSIVLCFHLVALRLDMS